jgi:hypothetical protein
VAIGSGRDRCDGRMNPILRRIYEIRFRGEFLAVEAVEAVEAGRGRGRFVACKNSQKVLPPAFSGGFGYGADLGHGKDLKDGSSRSWDTRTSSKHSQGIPVRRLPLPGLRSPHAIFDEGCEQGGRQRRPTGADSGPSKSPGSLRPRLWHAPLVIALPASAQPLGLIQSSPLFFFSCGDG